MNIAFNVLQVVSGWRKASDRRDARRNARFVKNADNAGKMEGMGIMRISVKIALAGAGAFAAFALAGNPLSGDIVGKSAAASVPTVEEHEYLTETMSGLQFEVFNPSDSPGEIFSWIAFMDGDRIADARNGWGYQTVTDVDEWNADMTSDGSPVDIDPDPIKNPVSWAELFAPISDEAQNLLQQDMVGIGFFLPIFSPEFGDDFDFMLGGEPFIQSGFGITPGESQDEFFALKVLSTASPMAFAHLPSNSNNAPIITTSEFESMDIPVPATAVLFGFGLAGLGLARRRSHRPS